MAVAADDEIRAAALEYVGTISGFCKPAPSSEAVFERAVGQAAAPAAMGSSYKASSTIEASSPPDSSTGLAFMLLARAALSSSSAISATPTP